MRIFWSAATRGHVPLLFLIAGLFAGCASENRPPRASGPDGAARVATLSGRETFFSGSITADVRVGAMAGFKRAETETPNGPENRPRRGGPMMGGMGGGPGAGMGGGGGRRDGGDAEGPAPATARRAAARGSPPVMIHLRFTNHGATAVDLQITDFLSPLGNFVVQPSSLRLEPGQSAEVEPMTSRLAGEGAAGEIKLSLRLGGTKESKIVVVRPETAAQPTAP